MLTIDDTRSATAARLRELIEQRLADYRAQLEGDRPELVTAKLRGRIAENKELLALLTAAPADAPAPDDAVGLGAFGLDHQPKTRWTE